ncbi:hypothetical protein HPB52_015140 [Rhipicephalus sanguineus]|uniref:Uncharacterized protein n=1 Tax=Rhipicephalus sanguineus TaxID=34632 RepID=A0A9D4PN15_RHISA|nr:hypothetical protein HPB52_015140 [Rhipicephalus sanguineus]
MSAPEYALAPRPKAKPQVQAPLAGSTFLQSSSPPKTEKSKSGLKKRKRRKKARGDAPRKNDRNSEDTTVILDINPLVNSEAGGVRKVVQKTLSESLIITYRDSVDMEHPVDALQRGMNYFNRSHLNPSLERCSVPYSCCKRSRSSNSGSVAASLHCGQGVLNMSDAWHKVHIDSCTDAVNIKDNVIVIGGGSVVVVILLSFIDMITNTVIDEIDIIRSIYVHAAAATNRQHS